MELDMSSFDEKVKWSFKSRELLNAFNSQKNLFETISRSKIENPFNSDFILPANTLIHGTSFDENKLLAIKNTGILAGDFIGIEEQHEETPFMADFFRLEHDTTLANFFALMNGTRNWNGFSFSPINPLGTLPTKDYIDVSNCRLPFLQTEKSENNIAFLLNGSSNILQNFQYFDYYRRPNSICENLANKRNTSCFYPPEMSAIFLGVPSNLISAIVIGSEVEKDANKIEFLKTTFDLPILSSAGKFVYVPNKYIEHYNIEKIQENFEKDVNTFASTHSLNYHEKSKFADKVIKAKQNQQHRTQPEKEM